MTSSQRPHSPLPWHADSLAQYVFATECGSDFPVLQIRGWGHLTGAGGLGLSDDEAFAVQEANAAFIVRACNSHYELLEALKAVVAVLQQEAPGTALNHHKYDGIGAQALAAIAKAER